MFVAFGFLIGFIVIAVTGQEPPDRTAEFGRLCNEKGTGRHYIMAKDRNCRQFAVCENGWFYGELQCPWGTLFDEENGTCEVEDNVNCGPSSRSIVPNCLHGVNPNNCSMFHWCYLGTQYDYACPDGLYYSSEHGVCMFSDDLSQEDREKCNNSIGDMDIAAK